MSRGNGAGWGRLLGGSRGKKNNHSDQHQQTDTGPNDQRQLRLERTLGAYLLQRLAAFRADKVARDGNRLVAICGGALRVICAFACAVSHKFLVGYGGDKV